MYRLCLTRNFSARHFLVGGDWGAENHEHAHNYKIEWEISGSRLDKHGYLVDLIAMESILDAAIAVYAGQVLNSFDEFAGLNPSLERFAAQLCKTLARELLLRGESVQLLSTTVKLWEHENAWAAFDYTESDYAALRRSLTTAKAALA